MTMPLRYKKLIFAIASFSLFVTSFETPVQAQGFQDSCFGGCFYDQCRAIFFGAAAGAAAGYAAGRTRRGKSGPPGNGICLDTMNPLVVTATNLLPGTGTTVTYNLFIYDPSGTLQAEVLDTGAGEAFVNPILDILAQAYKPKGIWQVVVEVVTGSGMAEAPVQLVEVQFDGHDPCQIPSAPQTYVAGNVFTKTFVFPKF